MSTIRGGVEQSRERLVALVLLLQRAWQYGPLTQEEILRDLKIDEFPVSAKGPKKIQAYEGVDSTVRQKFERDKARIRELGFEIETVPHDDGTVGYKIDPSSGYAPTIYFNEAEERVVKLALKFCGFGKSGAFSVFNEVAASEGGMESSNFYTPVLRALHLHRALAFDYLSATKKPRLVEPLVIDVFNGTTYLVARVKDTEEIKGYRFTRMTSMPVVLPDTFDVDDETSKIARAWRPEFSKSLRPVDVVVATNENYADLLVRQYPDALAAKKRSGVVEVGMTFDNPRSALRFVLDSADRVRLQSPKSLKNDLATWLKGVNRGKTPALSSIVFDQSPAQDVLGQTLQLLQAVYLSEDGLRVSELARRFALSNDHVRLIMDRLVSLEPMADSTDGTDTFPAHLIKECDDWEDEKNDDSVYRADFSDLPDGVDDPSPFMWRDLFELNIALREASRIYTDPAIFSAIEKIESATSVPLQVEMASNEAMLAHVEKAIEDHSQIKIEYLSGTSDETQVRAIEPREMKVLNGHTYVRAYCTSRESWRTFRIDRIHALLATSPASDDRTLDEASNWLTQVGDEGDEVIVVVDSNNRWLFEPLPGARWTSLKDDRLAFKFRVSDGAFMDHLMLRAGSGAVVASSKYAKAGHELARRIAAQL
jgi:predicted DNA-binding transcriptional regulator YafY